ncbi:MAG TPA: TRAP transporter substrate-binding protein DctP [Stellaceae bacterium]|nr:TRAP transporter substrate-binding protein DctP [Stellaceae bacterium]
MTHLTRRALGVALASVAVPLALPHIRRAGAAEPLVMRVSLDTVPSHPRNIAFHDFLPKVEKASDGRIQTKLFESGSLFPDLQVSKALVQGQVEMVCPGTWTITGFVPDADFSQLPAFYGQPVDIVHKATDGSAAKFVNQKIAEKLGVQVLGAWFDLGFNNWFSTKKPLGSLADLKDMKLRSPGGVLNSWRIRFFGGIPNVTAWPDVPLAMSQGTFDGLISTNESAYTAKLYDSGLRHSIQDHQGMGLYVPMVNKDFWGKLDPKLREAIAKLWAENLPAYRVNTAKAQQSGRDDLAKAGVTMVDIEKAEADKVREKMLAEQDKVAADAHMSPELIKLVMADVGA